MIVDIELAKIGMAMQDAMVTIWLCDEGDQVEQGEPLLEIETEKVSTPIESPATGVLVEILIPAGEVVEVGEVLGRIEAADGEESAPSATVPKAEAEEVIPEPELEEGPTEEEMPDVKDEPAWKLGATVPAGRMRRIIARRMAESLQTTAQLTMFAEADVTAMVAKRQDLKATDGVTYTDIVVYLVARTLRRFPLMNARLLGDDQIVVPEEINVGVAAALPDGLIVPVVHRADQRSLAEISGETAALVEKARQGQLTEQEITGGTFTVSNLGTFGIDHFTPILNLPESAILGVGRIAKKPVVVEGQVAVRSVLGLSLTIDHRVIDGAPAAEFLQALITTLESAEF
jgi:pyruvate dehydrogenase E2 component (dihydrolipoamide acetyltransferase)